LGKPTDCEKENQFLGKSTKLERSDIYSKRYSKMKQNVAPTSLTIKVITLFVLLFTLGMFIGALFVPELLWVGIVLAIIVVLCYLFAPIAYELTGRQLAIVTRINKKLFGPVLKCSTIGNEKPSFGLRLWGNGGLFAATGIFWNKKYGTFRAYVTTGERSHLVLVGTPTTKVLISPENPEQFVTHINSSNITSENTSE